MPVVGRKRRQEFVRVLEPLDDPIFQMRSVLFGEKHFELCRPQNGSFHETRLSKAELWANMWWYFGLVFEFDISVVLCAAAAHRSRR